MRWPLPFGNLRIPPNGTMTTATSAVATAHHVRRLVIAVRSRCPYLQYSAGYWEVLLERVTGRRRRHAPVNLLWDLFIERIELGGYRSTRFRIAPVLAVVVCLVLQ